jgi:hypothetical protein
MTRVREQFASLIDYRTYVFGHARPLLSETGSSDMNQSTDTAKPGRRRRRWIVMCSLPGYVALATFALIAWMQSSRLDLPEPFDVVMMPFALISMLSWGLAPFFTLFALVILLWDLWRRERPCSERAWLTLVVLGSPVAWFLSNLINDKYHLLR